MDIFNEADEDKIFMFEKTYNAFYIENFSETKLRVVREDSNPILQKLIDNLSISKTYNVQYIEGPKWVKKFVLTYTDDEGGVYYKTICVFGERHGNSTDHCKNSGFDISIPFAEYLKRLSRETSSFFDVFIELPMFIKKPKGKKVEPSYYDIQGHMNLSELYDKLTEDSSISLDSALKEQVKEEFKFESKSETINDVVKEFKPCLQPSTRRSDEQCELLRIHNIDVRSFWAPYIDTDDLSYSFNLIYTILGNNMSNIEKCIDLFNRTGAQLLIKTLSNTFTYEDIYDIFLTNSSIQKEIEKTSIQNHIETFIKSEIQELENEFDFLEIAIICRLILKRKDCVTRSDLTSLLFFCLVVGAITVDLYAICRMFKNYKHKLDNFQPRQNINIIVYAGQKHSERYCKFLYWLKDNQDEFDVEETYNYTNDNDDFFRCVKMFD